MKRYMTTVGRAAWAIGPAVFLIAIAAVAFPAAAREATGGGPAAIENTSYLTWAFQALGIGYTTVFLGLSSALLALLIMNGIGARRENVCPTHLLEAFENRLDEKQYQEAYELARDDPSLLGRVLAVGMARLRSGHARAIDAMHEVQQEENMKFDHRLGYLALVASIAPMVGLFGTVHGMISSFSVIARMNKPPAPYELAAGISTALFTTLLGLAIAIPAMAGFALLRNRVSRLVLQAGILSETAMSRFEEQ